jgi:hypothetical protein
MMYICLYVNRCTVRGIFRVPAHDLKANAFLVRHMCERYLRILHVLTVQLTLYLSQKSKLRPSGCHKVD